MRIAHSSDLTPAVLTEILCAGGFLRAGSVRSIARDMESAQIGLIANVATFEVRYSPGATGDPPRRLFLKVTKPDLHPEYRGVGRHEVQFYATVLPLAHDLPAPRCYYAEWDAESQRAALLLADLSQSHMQRPLPVAPAATHCYRIVESLARVHARWWNDPRLGTTIGARLTPEQAEAS